MFKIDKLALERTVAAQYIPVDSVWTEEVDAICADMLRQLRSDPRGASLPEDLGEALEVLLASHKALAEAGEDLPDGFLLPTGDATGAAHIVLDKVRPIIGRLRRERDEARMALAEAGEEMPSVRDVDVCMRAEWHRHNNASAGVAWQRTANIVVNHFRPIIARLRRERDEARKAERVWRELQEREIPCGHKVEDLIGGAGQVTKCGACLMAKQAAK